MGMVRATIVPSCFALGMFEDLMIPCGVRARSPMGNVRWASPGRGIFDAAPYR